MTIASSTVAGPKQELPVVDSTLRGPHEIIAEYRPPIHRLKPAAPVEQNDDV